MLTLAERRAAARAARAALPWTDVPREAWLAGAHVVVFDTETTGVDPTEARIVEVAAVRVKALGKSEPVPVFRSLVNPGVPIPSGAVDVHGITDEEVATAPTWAQVLPELLRALGDEPFVPAAYNIAYDQQVLQAETVRAGAAVPPWMQWGWPSWLDPLVLVRAVDKYEKGKKLREAAGRRGIHHAEHGATADAVVSGLLLAQLLAECARGVRDRRGAVQVQLPRGLRVWEALEWQRALALEQERDAATYMAGRKTPYDWPWHTLCRVEPPHVPPPEPSTATCKSCGAPILWLVNAKGTRCPADPPTYEVVTYADLQAAGVELATVSEHPRRLGYIGHDDGSGIELPPDVLPTLRRVPLRLSHFATCPHAGQHRRGSDASP